VRRGYFPDDPNPALPRSLSVSSSTTSHDSAGTGRTTSCAMRSPGRTT